eukprot:12406400-Alexandrium_andersonii.AAC.1
MACRRLHAGEPQQAPGCVLPAEGVVALVSASRSRSRSGVLGKGGRFDTSQDPWTSGCSSR